MELNYMFTQSWLPCKR